LASIERRLDLFGNHHQIDFGRSVFTRYLISVVYTRLTQMAI